MVTALQLQYLKKAAHPNVVEAFGMCAPTENGLPHWLLLEYAENGSLDMRKLNYQNMDLNVHM